MSRRRRGEADLLTTLMVLVALGGGDVAVDGYSRRRFFFFFSSVSLCFFFPLLFFFYLSTLFLSFLFPFLLVPSQSLYFSPLCLRFSIFFFLVCFALFLPSSLFKSLSSLISHNLSLLCLSFLFPLFFLFSLGSRPVEWGIYRTGEAGATLPLSNHGDKVGWLGQPLCNRLSHIVWLPYPIFIKVAGEGRELCQGLDEWGEGERGNMGDAKEMKKNLIPLPLHVREEEDIQCRSKRHRFGFFL